MPEEYFRHTTGGNPPAANRPLYSGTDPESFHPVMKPGVHLGVHNPRKPRSLPVLLGKEKGQQINKTLICRPFYFA